MNELPLPQSGESNEIGRLAIKALRVASPDSWEISEASREEDNAGIDLSVQIIQGGYHRQSFHIQAKGSAQRDEDGEPRLLNKSGDYYSVQLETTVLNYYATISSPVMLTFSDLTSAPKAKDCKSYYLWIDSHLERLLGRQKQIPSKQESHVFRVPVSNLVTDELDVLPYLDDREGARRLGRDLVEAVANKLNKPPLNTAAILVSRLESREVAIPSLLEDDCERPWIKAPKTSITSKLERSAKYLEFGNIGRAKAILESLGQPCSSDPEDHVQAEIHYQQGKILEFHGDYENAGNSYYEATQFSNASIYDNAWCESQLTTRGNADLAELLEHTAEKDGRNYSFLRAKIYALMEDREAALAESEALRGIDAYLCRALVHFMTGQPRECRIFAERGLRENGGSPVQQMSLYLLLARSLFDLGLPEGLRGQKLFFGGLQEMSPEEMRSSWDAALSCWEVSQEIGYPRQVELLADISVHLATYFQETDRLLPKLVEAARKHPGRAVLQGLVLSLAQFLGHEQLVEEFIAKLPASLEKICHQAFFLLKREQKSEFLNLVEEHLEELAATDDEDNYSLIEQAALFATELDQEMVLDKLLDKLPDREASVAFIRSAIALVRRPLDRSKTVEQLWTLYLDGRRDFSMCSNLFGLLNPHETEDAAKLLQLRGMLEDFRALSNNELLKLCVAAVSLQEWPKALSLCDSIERRFGISDKTCQVRALALDHLGDTPGALSLLEKVCSDPKADSESLRTLAHIAARCGRLDEAYEMLKKISERNEDQYSRRNTLYAMFEIEALRDLQSSRLHWLWKGIGRAVDRQDEIDEGSFLLLTLSYGHFLRPFSNDEEVEQHHERVRQYCKQFPNSRVFKMLSIPSGLDGSELLEFLDNQIGVPEETKRNKTELAERVRRGDLAIPYPMRHRFLPECMNTIELFHATRHTEKSAFGYQLHVGNRIDSTEKRLQQLATRTPLLDEVSLLVLHELKLFPRLMEFFSRVAIPIPTIRRIQNTHLGPDPASAITFSRGLFSELARYSERIYQIPLSTVDSTSLNDSCEMDGIRKTLQSRRDLVLFSDDAFTRQLVLDQEIDKRGMATPDFLEMLRASGRLANDELVNLLGQYCSWNVANVSLRYVDVLRPLHGKVADDVGASEVAGIAETDPSVCSFLDVIWIPSDPKYASHLAAGRFFEEYERLRVEAAKLLGYMLAGSSLQELKGGRVCTGAVGGLWLAWYHRVKTAMPKTHSALRLIGDAILDSTWVASEMSNRPDLGARAWRSFLAAWEAMKGDRMDKSAEQALIRNSGRLLAKRKSAQVKDSVFTVLADGLTDGTEESELFSHEYSQAFEETLR